MAEKFSFILVSEENTSLEKQAILKVFDAHLMLTIFVWKKRRPRVYKTYRM
jgi:hypothetical protein